METEKSTIIFTLLYQDKEYTVHTRRDEYPGLMSVVSAHLPVIGFGLCCGMGSCGTCMVEISEKGSLVKHSVLSCEVPINDYIANTVVSIAGY
jgi:hypothetical protein